jgi:hypothetical protein
MKIVVARYNEDVAWTKQFSNVIIYNKGNNLDDYSNVITLNNVGREGHTFYKYIFDNYDNLDDYTIFLQGHPFDHCNDIIDLLTKYTNDENFNSEFELIGKKLLIINLSGCSWHPGLPLIEVYEKLFGEKKEKMELHFKPGGQFIVSKKLILSKPQLFYFEIVNLLNYDVNPIEGYVIERFHKLIFNEPIINKLTILKYKF